MYLDKLKEDIFYKKLFALSLPIIFQNFMTTALDLMDSVMIGAVGSIELAAVGLANQIYFLLFLVLFGVNNGVAVYIAQFWGDNNKKDIHKSVGLGLLSSFIIASIFFVVAFFFSPLVMELLIDDATVIDLGVKYMKIISFAYIFTGFSFALGVFSRSVEKARIPAIVSGISIVINIIMNYILIFGKFGMPSLGVEGAAYGTLIARGIEFILLSSILLKNDNVIIGKFEEMVSFDFKFSKKIFKRAFPVIINETLWALGTIVYVVMIGHIGPVSVAIFHISNIVYKFFNIIFIGFASACQVMVGNKIGAKKEKLADEYAFKIVKIAEVITIILAAIIFVVTPLIVKVFSLEPENTILAIKSIRVFMFYSIFKTFNLMMIVGVLRGGGDTKAAMMIEIAGVWGIGVPMAYIGAVWLSLPVHWVIAFIYCEEIFKAIIGFKRLISKKWINNVTLEVAEKI
ncbi:MAG: MATE family efflux transporter [Bacillota bacterium]